MKMIFDSETGMNGLRWFEDSSQTDEIVAQLCEKFVGKAIDYVDPIRPVDKCKVIIDDVFWDPWKETFMFEVVLERDKVTRVVAPYTNFRMRNGKRIRVEVAV